MRRLQHPPGSACTPSPQLPQGSWSRNALAGPHHEQRHRGHERAGGRRQQRHQRAQAGAEPADQHAHAVQLAPGHGRQCHRGVDRQEHRWLQRHVCRRGAGRRQAGCGRGPGQERLHHPCTAGHPPAQCRALHATHKQGRIGPLNRPVPWLRSPGPPTHCLRAGRRQEVGQAAHAPLLLAPPHHPRAAKQRERGGAGEDAQREEADGGVAAHLPLVRTSPVHHTWGPEPGRADAAAAHGGRYNAGKELQWTCMLTASPGGMQHDCTSQGCTLLCQRRNQTAAHRAPRQPAPAAGFRASCPTSCVSI